MTSTYPTVAAWSLTAACVLAGVYHLHWGHPATGVSFLLLTLVGLAGLACRRGLPRK